MVTRWIQASMMAMCLVVTNAHGFMLTLGQNQLNAMVALAFPQYRQYEGVDFTFSNPVIDLDALDDTVAVQVDILAKYQGMSVVARGKIQGEVQYRPALRQLQFVEPSVEELTILNNVNLDKQMSDALSRLEGKRFPVILLLDFDDLDLSLFGNRLPKSIEIRNKQLLIEL